MFPPEPENIGSTVFTYKTKAKILKCVTEDCYGCRYDRPRETKHPYLDPWNDIIEYYEKNAIKLCDELKNYRTSWIEVQLSWHVSGG